MQIINWYPGHIAKAQRLLKENIKLVDLVIEMLDARLPISSHFSFVDSVLNNKDRIIVLNKKDLSEQKYVSKAIEYWESKGIDVICTNLSEASDIKNIHLFLKKYHLKLAEKLKKRGILPRALRIMVLGLPNIGKSTLINRLVAKRSVKSENKPGVTKTVQWIRIGSDVELMDTPGVIPPKLENQDIALKLVMVGSVSTESYEPEETARSVLNYLKKNNPNFLQSFGEDFCLEKYAEMRNFKREKGEPDIERSSKTFLKEIRDGKLGRITFDLI